MRNGCASEFGDNLRLNAETVFLDLNGLHHGSFERFIARFHIGVRLTDLITAILESKGCFSIGHIHTQATTEYNNKTAFTIAAPNRLRYDSRPRFSTNHLDAKLIANPSSFNVVSLVPRGANFGFHSLCIWEHVFQPARISRYNDVEISFLQPSIH
jgi:hypothetical protein